MDLTFEVADSEKPFSIEVGFHDSFHEVKEKVQKYQGIPVSKQTLFFDDQPLQDDDIIIKSHLCENSVIQLKVAPDSDNTVVPPPHTTTIKLTVKILGASARSSRPFNIEMDVRDTVLQLKKKIRRNRRRVIVKVDAMSLIFPNVSSDQLLDHRSLQDCGISEDSCVSVLIVQPQPKLTAPALAEAAPSGGDKDDSLASVLKEQPQPKLAAAATEAAVTAASGGDKDRSKRRRRR